MNKPINNSLPLTETTLFILLSLVSESRHGYAIMKNVLRLSQGRIDLTAGTLYGAIKRLLELGWIERVEGDEPAPDTPGLPRKAYRLTDLGKSSLKAEIERLDSVMKAINLQSIEQWL